MSCIPSVHDITSSYPVGIATIDTHRTLKKKELILLTQSRSLSQALERQSNFWASRDQGVWSNHAATTIILLWRWTTIINMTCIVELRSQETKIELLTFLKTRLRAYAVNLPRYTCTVATVLTCDQSIDVSAHGIALNQRSPTTLPVIRSI